MFSGTSNTAAFARLQSGGLGVYGEKRFMLQELNQYSAVLAMPVASGVFAFQGDYFGSAAFNENQLGLAYARKVAGKIDVGVKFNYHTVHVPGYGNASAINFEAGTLLHLTEQLTAGFHMYNPFGSKIGKSGNEKLPAIFKTGLGYEASKNFFISSEFVKQADEPVNLNIGIQYSLDEKVYLRTGVSTLTNNTFAGIGLKLGLIRIDVNSAYHPQLGFTPGLLLLYSFNKVDKQ